MILCVYILTLHFRVIFSKILTGYMKMRFNWNFDFGKIKTNQKKHFYFCFSNNFLGTCLHLLDNIKKSRYTNYPSFQSFNIPNFFATFSDIN